MAFEYQGQRYVEPQDLKIKLFNALPQVELSDAGLKAELGRDFLGPDEIVALIQVAVARSVDYQTGLEDELRKIQASGKAIRETVYKKNLTGIGRGHSLDGLPVIALGLNGTKMIDSAFTGMVYSRSLVTSGRRRETTASETVIPRSISSNPELLREYLEVSTALFTLAADIKERYGRKVDAIQAFNKLKPYNDPADLFYVVPLSSLVNLSAAVSQERSAGTSYLPEEFGFFVDQLPELLDSVGMGQIYRLRQAVPRETYLHYNVFRAPEPDYASLLHEEAGNPLEPKVVRLTNDLPAAARAELKDLRVRFAELAICADAASLYAATRRNQAALSSFCRRYNDALSFKTISSLSWRVWSEQKRHATLKQHVESIYTAAGRAAKIARAIWPAIANLEQVLPQAEQAFVIEEHLKAEPEMLKNYVYHSTRQLKLYADLVEKGVPERDALYCVPRNVRVRTLESYDAINALSLELPLRLCTECEPERRHTSELKAKELRELLPEMDFLLEPKCSLGYCTEGNFCGQIKRLNPNYNVELHQSLAKLIADAGL